MASSASDHTGRLLVALGLTASLMVIEVVGGLWTGSLASGRCGQYADRRGGLSMSPGRVVCPETSHDRKHLRLFAREILAAVANGVVLFLVAGYILYEAVLRVWAPPNPAPAPCSPSLPWASE